MVTFGRELRAPDRSRCNRLEVRLPRSTTNHANRCLMRERRPRERGLSEASAAVPSAFAAPRENCQQVGYRNSRNLCSKHTRALTLRLVEVIGESEIELACNRSTILCAPSGICQLPLTLNSTRQFAGCEGCGIRRMTETPVMWSYSGCSRISFTTKATNSAAVFVSMHLSRLSYSQSSALSSSCALRGLSCISTTPLPSPGP